jgi:hypothetical protein
VHAAGHGEGPTESEGAASGGRPVEVAARRLDQRGVRLVSIGVSERVQNGQGAAGDQLEDRAAGPCTVPRGDAEDQNGPGGLWREQHAKGFREGAEDRRVRAYRFLSNAPADRKRRAGSIRGRARFEHGIGGAAIDVLGCEPYQGEL